MTEPGGTWHMTQDEQMISMFIAIAVVVCAVIGFKALWRDWRRQWDIDDYVAGQVPENADVVEIEKQHPVKMPRRPKYLGPRGWHT